MYPACVILEKVINLQVGDNTITLETNGAYMLVATGSNYGQGICFISQGYNMTVLKSTLLSNDISFGTTSYSDRQTMVIKNNSSGAIALRIFRII